MPTVRVADILPDGTLRMGGEPVGAAPPGGSRWIDLEQPNAEVLGRLAETFHLHPLAVEDCLHFDQRPKLEEYPGHLFVVIHAVAALPGQVTQVELSELHCFLLQGVLITVHDGPIAAIDVVLKRLGTDRAFAGRGVEFLLHAVCDSVVDGNFPLLDRMSDAIEELEERVLFGLGRTEVMQIFKLRQVLSVLRRTLSPQRDVLGQLSRGIGQLGEKTSPYFRDVYDHLTRIYEQIDADRDLLGNALDAYLSAVGIRTNEIMKRLTVISSIFLPLGFVVGFFGQNFRLLPFDSDWMFFVMLALIACSPALMTLWFWRRGWLGEAQVAPPATAGPRRNSRRRRAA